MVSNESPKVVQKKQTCKNQPINGRKTTLS